MKDRYIDKPGLQPPHRDALRVERKWTEHYRTLLALRDRLVEEQMEQLRATTQQLSPGGTHLAERGADEMDHDFLLALLAKEHDALAEINAAIGRILDGSYGVCERTGLPIPLERLRAVPWTRHVREIEQQTEKTNRPPTD